jgi:hypothetical protein
MEKTNGPICLKQKFGVKLGDYTDNMDAAERGYLKMTSEKYIA